LYSRYEEHRINPLVAEAISQQDEFQQLNEHFGEIDGLNLNFQISLAELYRFLKIPDPEANQKP
jgi:hypothetical protein